MSCVPPWAPAFENCLPAPVEFVPENGAFSAKSSLDLNEEEAVDGAPKKTRTFSASTPFTFCSINPVNNSPQARTCMFRGWLFDNHNTGVMIFTTDRRMQKYSQLKANSQFESCFYFEELKKQFRMQGFIQFLSLDEFPEFDTELNTPAVTIQPVKSFTNLAGMGSHINSFNRMEKFEPKVSFSPSLASALASTRSTTSVSSVSTDDLAVTKEPFNYPVYSPAYLNYISGACDATMQRPSMAPSEADWTNEYYRVWNSQGSKMKSTFRKPAPKTLLTSEARKKIDSITRGVDGSSDDAGLENFTVVLMFVNQVDYYKLDGIGRRWIYTRIQDDDWKEQEVCP
ncbi:hypothetical protein NADFUDRAFT_84489 [Nadsonia fulvescens var. elongata DSM 6958]|uniref:Pyridoxamine 5'-phosphate oxidase Alr4036 family FMN-binding domain-containing protein n=1 Tax=Nadsonia fulvescens var. elongata DSM 6958 TaxID=857566 RepID=A0A1E3PDQ8_9ASCO|nr:hypothetical protein NADFUDRAFT_84489 [Nadsonia fulvescens var. elongata DSM 6958]